EAVYLRLTAWLAPIMPFTMDEAWRTSDPAAQSVHLLQMPATPAAWRDESAAAEMAALRRVRAVVTGALEVERREKRIGASLEAAPIVYCQDASLAEALRAVDFAELCIASDVGIEVGDAPPGAFALAEIPGVAVVPALATGRKCARSWRYFD